MRIVVASTLTCGLNDTLKLALMYSGNVLTDPALNSVMMKSSIDRANASRAAARMPGSSSGNVTFQNVRIGDGAEVLGGLFEPEVETADAGPHGERDEAHLEHDVGDDDGAEPAVDVLAEERAWRATSPITISGVVSGSTSMNASSPTPANL